MRRKSFTNVAHNDANYKGFRKALKRLHKMTGDDLELLSLEDDNYIMNYVLEQIPVIKKLQLERDDLKRQVTELANHNYAREPEFVRQRLKLRDTLEAVDTVRRRISSRQIEPVLDKLNNNQLLLAEEARKFEAESEKIAHNYLEGNTQHEDFIKEYLQMRKVTNQKRILADNLAKELEKLRCSAQLQPNN